MVLALRSTFPSKSSEKTTIQSTLFFRLVYVIFSIADQYCFQIVVQGSYLICFFYLIRCNRYNFWNFTNEVLKLFLVCFEVLGWLVLNQNYRQQQTFSTTVTPEEETLTLETIEADEPMEGTSATGGEKCLVECGLWNLTQMCYHTLHSSSMLSFKNLGGGNHALVVKDVFLNSLKLNQGMNNLSTLLWVESGHHVLVKVLVKVGCGRNIDRDT